MDAIGLCVTKVKARMAVFVHLEEVEEVLGMEDDDFRGHLDGAS